MVRTILIYLSVFVSLSGFSQVSISGKVTDGSDGTALIGVTVVEKGTTNGTVTNIDGNYSLSVSEGATLTVSYIGYVSIDVAVNNRTTIDVSMEIDVEELEEVVVTAFGIERKQRALGYSQTEVGGDELLQAKEVSVASQLYGKVAGLEISKPATGPAGSTNVTIRGLATLQDSRSKPLIVIDGVPIDNRNYGQAGEFGGIDQGDVFSSLNPDDIETINVMKGAVAGTLYGERGANGVIVITTKKGSKNMSVEYNGNVFFDVPSFYPKFYQNEYGQGFRGEVAAFTNTSSWGDELDGSDYEYFDGEIRPYSAAPEDDILNYYETGYTISNNIAITGGNETMSNRLSFSSLQNEGIVPNSGYDRYTTNLISSMNLNKKFTIEMKANYIEEQAENRSNLGDNGSNPGKIFASLPANISVEMLRNTLRDPSITDKSLNAIKWDRNNAFVLNPFWGPLENIQEDTKKRLIGYALARYQIIDQLSFQVRYAIDYLKMDYLYVTEEGTEFNFEGSLFQSTREISDRTIDAMINFNQDIGDGVNLDVNLGGVQNPRYNFTYSVNGNDFLVSDVYHINNFAEKGAPNYEIREQQTNAVYATGLLDYKGFAFLEASVRNDWYSVLTNPVDPNLSDNKALYASGALSVLVSDIFQLPENVSFAKVRATYGTSGNANIDPYELVPITYGFEELAYDSKDGSVIPVAEILNNNYTAASLKPTITESTEVGFDLRLFRNRLGIDFAYYQQKSNDQLMQVSISRLAGYNSLLTNAGTILNEGVELLLSGSPIQKGDFSWDISFNLTTNKNRLTDLDDELEPGVVMQNAPGTVFSAAYEGSSVADIYGIGFVRDENGNIVHDSNGLPLTTEASAPAKLGNYNPDLYGGLTNNFGYKNWTLSMLFDYKFGGEIYSGTNAAALANGKHEETLGVRNSLFQMKGEGVNEAGEENDEFAFIDVYYGRLAEIDEYSVFDASYVKLRQVVLTYNFPANWIDNTPFKQARLSLTGRNLMILYSGVSDLGIDPESLYRAGSSGFEFATLPTSRSYGFNLFLKF